MPKNREPTYIYVIRRKRVSRPVKIGITGKVERRLAELQAGNHEKLVVAWSARIERPRFAETRVALLLFDKRLMGEWYDVAAGEAVRVAKRAIELAGCAYRPREPIAVAASQRAINHLPLGMVGALHNRATTQALNI